MRNTYLMLLIVSLQISCGLEGISSLSSATKSEDQCSENYGFAKGVSDGKNRRDVSMNLDQEKNCTYDLRAKKISCDKP